MNILQVFFWFCKEQKIMDIIYKMYYSNPNIGNWNFDCSTCFFEKFSLENFLKLRIERYGFRDLFWALEPKDLDLCKSERYKEARKKWNRFCANNVKFSEDFIKVGDAISYTNGLETTEGVVTEIPKTLDGTVKIQIRDRNYELIVPIIGYFYEIKINGERKEPKFFIKRKRKVYGINKE